MSGFQRKVMWSGKPYIMKTIVKALIFYLLFAMVLIPLFMHIPWAFLLYTVIVAIPLLFYVFWKKAHTYYITENSVLITRSWVFGTYQREITFDKIQDIHVHQGILARIFKCGSVVFVTTTGLEVGYGIAGGGTTVGPSVRIGTGGVVIGGGVALPTVVKGSHNTFLDVPYPWEVRELVMKHIVAWREAFQQQRIAAAVEKLAEKTTAPATTSIADELAKLKDLLDKGVITKEEFEKAKKKLLGE